MLAMMPGFASNHMQYVHELYYKFTHNALERRWFYVCDVSNSNIILSLATKVVNSGWILSHESVVPSKLLD